MTRTFKTEDGSEWKTVSLEEWDKLNEGNREILMLEHGIVFVGRQAS